MVIRRVGGGVEGLVLVFIRMSSNSSRARRQRHHDASIDRDRGWIDRG
jgi:hypothetical protein